MTGEELPLCSSAQVCKALTRAGFEPRRMSSQGSHQMWRKKAPGRTYFTVVVLGKREIPRGPLKSIIERAGMTVDEFKTYPR